MRTAKVTNIKNISFKPKDTKEKINKDRIKFEAKNGEIIYRYAHEYAYYDFDTWRGKDKIFTHKIPKSIQKLNQESIKRYAFDSVVKKVARFNELKCSNFVFYVKIKIKGKMVKFKLYDFCLYLPERYAFYYEWTARADILSVDGTKVANRTGGIGFHCDFISKYGELYYDHEEVIDELEGVYINTEPLSKEEKLVSKLNYH